MSSLLCQLVGTVGFEPTTSWSRTRRTTKLCYVPSFREAITIVREGKYSPRLT
jgi:hypothetical protein